MPILSHSTIFKILKRGRTPSITQNVVVHLCQSDKRDFCILVCFFFVKIKAHAWISMLYKIVNKMQSETADFAPTAATRVSRLNNVVWHPTGTAIWRTGRNIRVVFDYDLGYSLHHTKTWRHPQNRKYKVYRIAVRRAQSHGHIYHK